jgi:hypothetical protein
LSPIILDLDGDGVEMKSIKKSKAMFDMNGDGSLDDTGWTGKGDGFLVIDRNNDGLITSASELSFTTENPDARSDLEALAALDNNGDRVLNKDDARFKELKVWVDANDNGITDAGELKTLEEVGITEISLSGRAIDGAAKIGDNVLISTATFKRSNGSTGTLGNVALAFKPGSASAYTSGASSFGTSDLPTDFGLLSGTNGTIRTVSTNPGVDDSALLGEPLAQGLDATLAALRAGTDATGIASGLNFDVPIGANVFDYFETAARVQVAQEFQSSHDLPAEAVFAEKRDGGFTAEPLLSADDPQLSGGAETDRLLALMTQDMASFGRRTGESDLNWKRGLADRPTDFFA